MFSEIKNPEHWTLPNALQEMGRTRTDLTWVRTSSGDSLTFGQARDDAGRMAGYLASLGVQPGDFVLVMMSTGVDFIRVWAGIGRLGAVAVLLNTELSGAFLSHQLKSAGAKYLLTTPEFAVTIRAAAREVSNLAVVMLPSAKDTAEDSRGSDGTIDGSNWCQAPAWTGPMPSPREVATVMYTSGTSGPSKGVLMTHAHCTLFGIGMIDALQVNAQDVYYINLPLFHANGLFMQLGVSLLAGIPAFIRPRFSASAWLTDVCEQGATLTNMLGSTAAFVISRPPTALDRAHKLRLMFNAPNLPTHEATFRERFGVRDVLSGYGMTEVANPVVGHVGVSAPGAAGWVDKGRYELAVVDPETDIPVRPGDVGEIVVRPKVPFSMMVGYHEMPQKTVEAWRNLWFHTGDAGTMSEAGLVVFVDRIKDCIRRRGENISATELEMAVSGIAGVKEVAAYAVPSDIQGAEDEIMLAVVLSPAKSITASEIGHQAGAILPKFAQPRFIKIMDSLPKTATGKVQRSELRRSGTQGAFDCQSARPQ